MSYRSNVFSRVPLETLKQIISNAGSIAGVFRALRLRVTGGQYRSFRATVKRLAIDISHLRSPKSVIRQSLSNSEVFIENSTHATSILRNKIRQQDLKLYMCTVCGNEGKWKDKALILELDHINGNSTDNRLENLKYLCPNCHSQTDTHSRGRRRLDEQTKRKTCPICQGPFEGYGIMCVLCAAVKNGINRVSKSNWPSKEKIKAMVWSAPMSHACKTLGCSARGLKKFCMRNDIDLPPQGYWRRRELGYSHQESLDSKARIRDRAKRLNQDMIDQVVRLIDQGYSLREAARSIGFSHSTLSRHLNHTKKDGGRLGDRALLDLDVAQVSSLDDSSPSATIGVGPISLVLTARCSAG